MKSRVECKIDGVVVAPKCADLRKAVAKAAKGTFLEHDADAALQVAVHHRCQRWDVHVMGCGQAPAGICTSIARVRTLRRVV